jgi:amino-acid N-acetyltransferase
MLRKATVRDVQTIHALLKAFADKGELLPRSISDICDDLRDFYVFEEQGRVIGCGALHLTWTDLAEIRSIAVSEEGRGKGIGSQIVNACIQDARSLGVSQVFVLTFIPDFFARFGFRRVAKETFPHKIWLECVNCHHFPDCGEVAMSLELPPKQL